MKHMKIISCATLLLCLAIGGVSADGQDAAPPVPAKRPAATLTVAVLNFDANTPGNPDLGKQIGEALTATLSGEDGFTLVDRSSLSKSLAEAGLNLTGVVNTDQAIKVGKLVGAKILVTGRVFPLDKQLFFTAKLVGTETSLVEAVLVKGDKNADIGDLLMKLSEKVSTKLREKGPTLVAQDDAMQDPLPALKRQLAGRALPKIAVVIKEAHVGTSPARVDPAAETEVRLVLRQAGFTVIEGDEKQLLAGDVRYVVEGEAFSEFGAQVATLVNCIARVEVKMVDRKTGEVAYTDRETSRAVDLAENVAGKTALQKAGRTLGIKIVRHLADTLPAAAK